MGCTPVANLCRGGARGSARGHLRHALILVAALLGGGMLALFSGVGIGTTPQAALACGMAAPVMQANNLLATLDPNTANTDNGLPDTGGRFALSYVSGTPIAFDENLSYLQSVAPPNLKLRWSFGDNTASVEGLTPSHTFANPGTYLVLVDYFDPTTNGWTFFDYAHIQVAASVPGNPPVAHMSVSNDTAVADSDTLAVLSFDGNGSKSQDGSPVTYSWDFNDGTRATGAKVTHKFVAPGRTLVELTVTDARGAKSVATTSIVVVQDVNNLPVAAVTADSQDTAPGHAVTFDASQTQPPSGIPNDQIVSFKWDFGDGTPAQTTTAPTISHTFAQTGNYTVTVHAYDLAGADGTATVPIAVSTAGPNWALIGFGGVALAGLAVGGFLVVQAQRRQNALIRARQQAMQLARARRVTSRSDPRRDVPPRHGPPRGGPPARRH